MSATPLERLTSSFALFLQLLWKSLGLPPPTRAQLAMADYLQNGGARIQLQMFRGVGKSWVTAAFVLWTLFCDVDKKILVISASKPRADDFTIFCQRCILEIDWLNHLAPQDSDESRWSRVSFDVQGAKPSQSPSLKSLGITSQITGSRADIIVPDDIETPMNSATDLMREKLLQLVTEFESVLIPKPESRIIYLGTPQTAFTIYRSLEQRGYAPMVWPSRYPTPETLAHYGSNLASHLQDDIDKHGIEALKWKPTDTRFSEEILRDKEMSMSRSNYMLQFQLDTSLSDQLKFPLKIQDILVMPLDPKAAPSSLVWRPDKEHRLDLPAVSLPGDRWYRPAEVGSSVPWYDTIVAVDPSGRGRDETVAWVLSQVNGNIFARDIFVSTDGYSDRTLRSILTMGRKHGATRCVVESNFGDGLVMEVMKKHAIEMQVGMNFEEVRSSTRKEDRIIDTLELVMNQHRLILDQKIVEWDYISNPDMPLEERLPRMFSYQLTRICREKGALKHDDRVDALALGVKYFQDVLAVSAQEAIKQDKREQWDAMVRLIAEDPVKATDALVLGLDFRQVGSQGRGKVYSGLPSR